MQKNITPFQDINNLIIEIKNGIEEIIGKNLIGLYLFGSLSYGGFNLDSSDIDLVTIIEKPLNQQEIKLIQLLHERIKKNYPKWSERLECSYTPINMLNNILPPKEPRPWYGGGHFYEEAPYGNEWIINNYLLYEHSIPLEGPAFRRLTQPISIIEVQKACIRDLFQEWEPKMSDFEWLDNSHYQSYIILNLCRILYTVMCGDVSTKKISAEFVKNKFGLPWKTLIETAQNWKYGLEMSTRNETIDFIKFVIEQIKQTPLYHEIYK